MLSSLKMVEAPSHSSQLLAVAQTGDRAAFADLYAHFAPRLKSYLMRGGTSVSEAEELAQEVMLRVWNRAHSYDPRRAAVSTWIFTIARNLRIDRIRKMKRVDVDPEDPAMVASDAPSPESDSQLRERIRAVRAELQALPPAQAEILNAMYYQGHSQVELAAELGLALGTVKSRVRLATQTLRGGLDRFQLAPDGESQ